MAYYVPQLWSMISIIICTSHILSLTAEVKSYPEPDKIPDLPGQPKVDFQQYSGYVTVDEKQGRKYFYYFAEAEIEPNSKPLVLWLTGGPGCSSLGAGAFIEHGPFKPTNGEALIKNEYSWNKAANMIYLESPAGVGFSYSDDASFYKSVDDNITSRDNLVFVEKWLEEFPEFKDRDFFIAGDSYSGHYVPQLADLVVRQKPKFVNLKGIAIGNPLLEFDTDFNSQSEYLWSHGLISDSTYQQLTYVCNYSQINRQVLITGILTPDCAKVNEQASSEISNYTDLYDVTLDVCLPTISQSSRKSEEVDVCVPDETGVYLNRKDVQTSLHARLVGVENWTICSKVVNYTMQDLEIPIVGILGSLVESGVRVIVYSGDQDSDIPLIGTRKLIDGLASELKLTTTRPYSAWLVGRQIGGWTQEYGKLLSFATIRGASHAAPFTQPERSLVLFTSFLANKPLPSVTATV